MLRRDVGSFALVIGTLTLGGCNFLRTPYLLKTLNSGVSSAPSSGGATSSGPSRPSPSERVAAEVRAHLADSYFDPKQVADWLVAAGAASEPLTQQLDCLREQRPDPTPCYTGFEKSVPLAWKLPPAAATPGASPTPPAPTDAGYYTEVDVERVVANARGIASSLSVIENSIGVPLSPADLKTGLQAGMLEAASYLRARHWQRQRERPTVALVMSGGGATGAFTAGFVSRLMDVLNTCHHTPSGDACPNAKIDLVVGTSTGTLVGMLVDLFQVPGREQLAQETLIDNYTCSTEKDLYCQHDEYDWHLAEHQRGLMRFSGIESKLAQTLNGTPALLTNPSEFVTVTVDYDSGSIFAQSDQDPADAATGDDRVQTVLASIVEPVLSDPVDHLMSHGKRLNGTFIDGGVRSGVPLLEAVRRGAERTLVVTTSSIDIGPTAHAESALPILMRTLDLATSQNLAAELQQADLEAVARRWAEYNFCRTRFPGGDNDAVLARERFCRRDELWPAPAGAQAAAVNVIGPGLFPEVAKSWRSAWVNRPENGAAGAVGYTFDPVAMRRLFEDGVRTFQARCQESLALLGVPAAVRAESYACQMSVQAALDHAHQQFKPISACHADDRTIPSCE